MDRNLLKLTQNNIIFCWSLSFLVCLGFTVTFATQNGKEQAKKEQNGLAKLYQCTGTDKNGHIYLYAQ